MLIITLHFLVHSFILIKLLKNKDNFNHNSDSFHPLNKRNKSIDHFEYVNVFFLLSSMVLLIKHLII